MCEFNDSNGNVFGDIWWTDKLIYFSSIDSYSFVSCAWCQILRCRTTVMLGSIQIVCAMRHNEFIGNYLMRCTSSGCGARWLSG